MQIQITQSQKGFWYAGLEGQTFEAELVEMPVKGHVHKVKVFEVLDGEYQGDFVLQGDCSPLSPHSVQRSNPTAHTLSV